MGHAGLRFVRWLYRLVGQRRRFLCVWSGGDETHRNQARWPARHLGSRLGDLSRRLPELANSGCHHESGDRSLPHLARDARLCRGFNCGAAVLAGPAIELGRLFRQPAGAKRCRRRGSGAVSIHRHHSLPLLPHGRAIDCSAGGARGHSLARSHAPRGGPRGAHG